MLMQTVRIKRWAIQPHRITTDGRWAIQPHRIATDGQDHGSSEDEEGSGDDPRPPPQLPTDLAAVALELSCDECWMKLAYHALHSPGTRAVLACSLLAHQHVQDHEISMVACCPLQPAYLLRWKARLHLPTSAPLANAGGEMLNWEGCGTRLPPGFTTLRTDTNFMGCWAMERTPRPEPAAAGRCIKNPVHLLCRALRMAPASYRRFELTATEPPLHVFGGGIIYVGNQKTLHEDRSVTFSSIADLANAMQRYAAAESLSLHLLPEERSIVISRIGDALLGGVSMV